MSEPLTRAEFESIVDCIGDYSDPHDFERKDKVMAEYDRLVAENERLKLLNLRARNHLAAIRAVLRTLADNYEYLLGVNSISMTEKMKDVRLHIINDARNLIEANIDYNPPENSPALEEKK